MKLNELFIFPFEKIEKNSKVVLYAFGSVGRCYYEQIIKTGYCKIVAIVDVRAELYTDVKFDILPPEKLSGLEYDYLVVGLNSRAVAERTIETIKEKYGVPSEKIIYEIDRKVPIQNSIASLQNILNGADVLDREVDFFLQSKYGDISFFSHIIDEMLVYSADKNCEEFKQIQTFYKQYICTVESPYKKIVALRILYKADYFDAECMEIFCSAVIKIPNPEHRIWLLFDLSVMERDHAEYRHQKFYIDKKRIMKENMDFYKRNRIVEKKFNDSNAVAIITYGLGTRKSAHNILIVPYAKEMVRQKKKVKIFAIELFRYRYGECFIQPIEPIEQDAITRREEHKLLFGDEVEIAYNYGETIEERINQFLTEIAEFNPSVVYDFCGEYSYLSPLFYEMYPTVALPMRGYITSSFCDVYMTRSKDITEKENQIYHSVLDSTKIVEGLVCSEGQAALDIFERRNYNIPNDAFVIVTVGARLKSELTNDFVDEVCEFLNNHNNVYWILVGDKICDYIKEKYSQYIEQKRIVDWGYEYDLIGLYGICDLYWNPNRMGASGSMASAMRCGIPVVTTNYPSDILPRIGVENTIDGDYKDCRKEVERLYSDRNYYEQKSALMKKRMSISTVSSYVALLLKTGKELVEKKTT